MRSSSLFALFFLFSLCYAVQWSHWEDNNMAEKKFWRPVSVAGPQDKVEIFVGMNLRNTEQLPSMLMDVSDPQSPNYGSYMSQQDMYDFTSPSKHNVDEVANFLVQGRGDSVSILNNGGFLSAVFEVNDLISLFSGEGEALQCFRYISTKDSSRFVVRCPGPIYLPSNIASKVQLFEGLNNFPYLQIKKVEENDDRELLEAVYEVITGDSAASVTVTFNSMNYDHVAVTVIQGDASSTQGMDIDSNNNEVEFLFSSLANYQPILVDVTVRNTMTGMDESVPAPYDSVMFPSPWVTSTLTNLLYSIPLGTHSTNETNSQAVAEFDRQYYSPDDLSQFSNLMGVPQPNVTVRGPNDPDKPKGESTLDIQWITAIGQGVPTVFWSVKHGFLLAWAITVQEDPSPPFVHSISYGEPETYMDATTLDRTETEFMLLGMRGLSIISTSGDLGDSDGTDDCDVDIADYPSSSPWTTSLGATFVSLQTDAPICSGASITHGIPIQCGATAELPCAVNIGTSFTTGGGFSTIFERPPYQDVAVQSYLESADLPPSSYFNSSGRGYNDVGALGFNILVIMNGEIEITGGTSASGPIFAGVIALLNDIQLNRNLPTLGFLNNWLYQTAGRTDVQAFNQVLSGDNSCRELGEECCEYGFTAQEGWNPLSGVGTPVYSTLKESLPGMY